VSDRTLRDAHRAWGAGGGPEEFEAYVRERQRMGLHGPPSPDPAAARALIAAWPRYKRKKTDRGKLRLSGLTYAQADSLARIYYEAAGWKEKLPLWGGRELPQHGWYPAHFTGRGPDATPLAGLPAGFPLERDPGDRPIPYGSLISPDFNVVLTSQGVRTWRFMVWSEAAQGYTSSGLSTAATWEVRERERQALARGSMPRVAMGHFDKKELALLLLDASLRVENPYHPNPLGSWRVWKVEGASWNLVYKGTVQARGPKGAETAARKKWGGGRYKVQAMPRQNPPRCDYDRVVFSDYSGPWKGDKKTPKRTAVFTSEAGRRRTKHFGLQGYEDYTMHHDDWRREKYLERHGRGRENWDDCATPGALSRWILWGDSTSRAENERAFRRRFGLKNPPLLNPDVAQRGIERAARAGDRDAQYRLYRHRQRIYGDRPGVDRRYYDDDEADPVTSIPPVARALGLEGLPVERLAWDGQYACYRTDAFDSRGDQVLFLRAIPGGFLVSNLCLEYEVEKPEGYPYANRVQTGYHEQSASWLMRGRSIDFVAVWRPVKGKWKQVSMDWDPHAYSHFPGSSYDAPTENMRKTIQGRVNTLKDPQAMKLLQLGGLIEIDTNMEAHENKIQSLQADMDRRMGWLGELTMDELGMEEWPKELPRKKRARRKAKKKARKKVPAKRNPDARLREAERRFAESGAHEDGVALNRAQRRAGLPATYVPPAWINRPAKATQRAVREATAALEGIAERHEHHSGPGSGIPENAIPGVLYASSAGGIWGEGPEWQYGSYGSRTYLLASLKIGGSFAKVQIPRDQEVICSDCGNPDDTHRPTTMYYAPEGHCAQTGDSVRRSAGYQATKQITDRIKEEATQALLPFIEEFGGFLYTSSGTNYSTIGWAQ
jgi:hypothetical protein